MTDRLAQARTEAERTYGHAPLGPMRSGLEAGFSHGVQWADANPKPRTIARDLCPGGFEDEKAFTIGARWQREALLSDETEERVADVLVALDGDDYLMVARAALAAALGIEGEQ